MSLTKIHKWKHKIYCYHHYNPHYQKFPKINFGSLLGISRKFLSKYIILKNKTDNLSFAISYMINGMKSTIHELVLRHKKFIFQGF